MGKFKDDFSSPMYMSNDTYAIDGGIPRDEAAHRISEEIGKPVSAEQLEAELVRFGYAPESVADIDSGTPVWYTGATGKGTKPVWVYEI